MRYYFRVRPFYRLLVALALIMAGYNWMLLVDTGRPGAIVGALLMFLLAALVLRGLLRMGRDYLRTWL